MKTRNYTLTSNYNYKTKSPITEIKSMNIDKKDYDKKLDFENSNLYFYRNIGLNLKPENELKIDIKINQMKITVY
jgi:predicted component of type VI protein secretion system